MIVSAKNLYLMSLSSMFSTLYTDPTMPYNLFFSYEENFIHKLSRNVEK